ncbi:MAG: hypothetical protein HC837_05615 [Chloroflexaceae bacterium]|nr:hypothetical protein [Chloroflexaceae bacterium]
MSKYRLKPRQKAWLVGLHVLSAGLWLGAGTSLILINLTIGPDSGLHAINATAKYIDDFLVIPAAIGSLLTGLLLSWFTNWGFFAYKWVTIKWVLTLASIILGTFWLGPWLNGMEVISATEHARALQDAVYLHYMQMNGIFGTIQVSSLVFMIFLSVLKPWKKWKQQQLS